MTMPGTTADVNIVNGTPYIKINTTLSGNVVSSTSDSKYLSNDVLEELSKYADSYLESMISSYLYKTSKDLKSDVTGFGKYAYCKFLTCSELKDYNWSEKYKDSFFDVKVNTTIKSSHLLTET